jgi:hypothetical protein
MTTYLTKTADGKTHHFRATVKDNGVEIVQGVFYNSLDKYFQGFGDGAEARAAFKKMVDEKSAEGYTETDFTETPENNMGVYDKAKWHYEGDFPKELDPFHGYIHTGMFLGWLIDHGFVSDQFKEDLPHEIEQFKKRQLTGARIFERCCDGVLLLEDVSETGNRFGIHYFNFDTGSYLSDYEQNLGNGLPSLYHVDDTWDNYYKLKEIVDKRFDEWQSRQ